MLFAHFDNGTVLQYSATPGDPYDPLSPSATPGNITTTFSLSNTGNLLWNSNAFFNGGALFCLLPSGIIIAVFQEFAQPQGCVYIDLTISTRGCWQLAHLNGSILKQCSNIVCRLIPWKRKWHEQQRQWD